jgi:hypothetical protein
MKRFLVSLLAIAVLLVSTAFAQAPTQSSAAPVPANAPEVPKAEVTVLRELHGVKLNMLREDVKNLFRKPNQSTKQMDEYKLDGGDILTVHYGAKGLVRVIQLYSTDATRVPAWADVIGDAEVQERDNGSRFARKVINEEKFWVTMYQSKTGAVTTITISRQNS